MSSESRSWFSQPRFAAKYGMGMTVEIEFGSGEKVTLAWVRALSTLDTDLIPDACLEWYYEDRGMLCDCGYIKGAPLHYDQENGHPFEWTTKWCREEHCDFGFGPGVAPLDAMFLDKPVTGKCIKCGREIFAPAEKQQPTPFQTSNESVPSVPCWGLKTQNWTGWPYWPDTGTAPYFPYFPQPYIPYVPPIIAPLRATLTCHCGHAEYCHRVTSQAVGGNLEIRGKCAHCDCKFPHYEAP